MGRLRLNLNIKVVRSCLETLRSVRRIIAGKRLVLDMAGKRGASFEMFNFFFNWLDPKIIRMEKWVNQKVVEPDKLDIDLDKVKKGEVRGTEMFNRTLATPKNPDGSKLGPFIVNLQNADLLSIMFGPGKVEAFALYQHQSGLWWRHRDGGVTHDFRGAAFDDMQEFVAFIDTDINYWECVLRTEARMSELDLPPCHLRISEIKEFMRGQDD